MSIIAGAPLVTDSDASLSKQRISELNEQYKARMTAFLAAKEAMKKAKGDSKSRKSSGAGGGI
jgi:hypothetical protein